ncbi:MAG: hypothetical protein KGL39_20310 [Patescibacteria group bacterium]|nr:hypothetical protein [Patescibacteria group bacterium]
MPEDLLEIEAETPEAEEAPEGEQPGAEGQQPEGEKPEGEKTPVTSLFQSDGKKFDPQVSAALNKIKGENPELGKLLLRAVSRVGELDREFPGGLNEVRELRDQVEEFGGITGIQEKLDSLQEMDGLAQQFMSADPAFVDDLIQSSPEAFSALAPVVFQKFAETNPDGFGAYIGRIVYANMQAAEIPLVMMRLNDLVADKPQAIEALKQLNVYLGGFRDLASKALPEFKGAKSSTPKNDDLSKREEALRSKEWQAERDSLHKGIVNTEYKRALAGRTPNSEEKAQILELFTGRATTAANRLFPGWQQKAQRYINANDKAGYLRYMETIYRRIVPEAVSSAVSSTMRGKATSTKKPATPARPAVKPAANGAGTEGFAPLAKEPDTWEIDYARTTPSMLRNNRAVLTSGKKVEWR